MLDFTSGTAHTPPAPRPLDTHDWQTCPCEAHAQSRLTATLAFGRALDKGNSGIEADRIAERVYRRTLADFAALRGES